MTDAVKRLGRQSVKTLKKPSRKNDHSYPELLVPGEKVKIDTKEEPNNGLCGEALRNNRYFCQ